MATLHIERYERRDDPFEFLWVGESFVIYARHDNSGHTEIVLDPAEVEQLQAALNNPNKETH